MRPQSIVLFERVYILCILLSLASGIIYFVHPPVLSIPANAPPAVTQMMTIVPVAGSIIGLCIALLFLYFIGRRGSDVARWIFVALFVIGLAGLARQFGSQMPVVLPLPLRVIAWLHVALEAVCVWLLFRPDAKTWFRAPTRDL